MRPVPTTSQQFQLVAPGAHGAAATRQRALTLCARGAELRLTSLTDWFLTGLVLACVSPGGQPPSWNRLKDA